MIQNMKEWKCNKVYLATEDKSIIEIFKNVFGDYCLTLNREYLDYKSGTILANNRIDRENDRFLQGKEYLKQILLLSKCKFLVSARTSAMHGALILSGGFENIFAFYNGLYGVYPKYNP